MHKYEVLRRPVLTEKTDLLGESNNQYVFEVAKDANKAQIKHAIESIFEVKVEKVRTAMMPGKSRRWGRHVSKTASWKKAMVTLAPGDRIDLFE
ncbi:MAG: 50S ribosomal protein L23 [Anaerolineae bacterium]